MGVICHLRDMSLCASEGIVLAAGSNNHCRLSLDQLQLGMTRTGARDCLGGRRPKVMVFSCNESIALYPR